MGWLVPLVARIANDRSVIVVPKIDAIDSGDISYVWNKMEINGFRFTLLFNM